MRNEKQSKEMVHSIINIIISIDEAQEECLSIASEYFKIDDKPLYARIYHWLFGTKSLLQVDFNTRRIFIQGKRSSMSDIRKAFK